MLGPLDLLLENLLSFLTLGELLPKGRVRGQLLLEIIDFELVLFGGQDLLELAHEPVLSDDLMESDDLLTSFPLVLFEVFELFQKSRVGLASWYRGPIFVDHEILDVHGCVCYVSLLGLVCLPRKLLFGLPIKVLELIGLFLHFGIDIHGQTPSLLLELGRNSLLMLLEPRFVLPELHFGLIEFPIVAKLDLLGKILLHQEHVVLQKSELPRSHVELIDKVVSPRKHLGVDDLVHLLLGNPELIF